VLSNSFIIHPLPVFDLDEKTSDPNALRELNDATERLTASMHEAKLRFAGDNGHADLIDVQLSMLTDTYFQEDIRSNLSQGYSARAAVLRAAKVQQDMLLGLDDEYMAARADDLVDLSNRLVCLLSGLDYPDISTLQYESIVIGQDLLPSMLLSADLNNLKGIVTEAGTRTSHVSILASGMDIPMIVGAAGAMRIPNNSTVYLDAQQGVVKSVGQSEITEYDSLVNEYNTKKARLREYVGIAPKTKDGERVMFYANITEPVVLGKVLENGFDGVGLFRTEFMYMDRKTLPTEEEQFSVYRMAAEKLDGKLLTIRTMDIGGDKSVPYLDLPDEENPFLGFRAIRIGLARQEILVTQLRAILRASAYGNVAVMFPMVATSGELESLLSILSGVKDGLRSGSVSFDEHIKTGIMIEIPSAAVMMNVLARYIDFVSIGSNDLIQYTLAADRLNKNVGYLYNCMDPAVLRLIKHTIDAAASAGIKCCLCGEMGGDLYGLAALVALGIREVSVSTSLGLIGKKRISLLDAGMLKQVGNEMLGSVNADEALRVLKTALPAMYHDD